MLSLVQEDPFCAVCATEAEPRDCDKTGNPIGRRASSLTLSLYSSRPCAGPVNRAGHQCSASCFGRTSAGEPHSQKHGHSIWHQPSGLRSIDGPPWPETLGGVEVHLIASVSPCIAALNGISIPPATLNCEFVVDLIYVSPTQINFVIPDKLTGVYLIVLIKNGVRYANPNALTFDVSTNGDVRTISSSHRSGHGCVGELDHVAESGTSGASYYPMGNGTRGPNRGFYDRAPPAEQSRQDNFRGRSAKLILAGSTNLGWRVAAIRRPRSN